MNLVSEKAQAVGNIPSGLFIVCAHDSKTQTTDGFLASWIQQVSFNPLLISLCIKPGRPAYELITSGNPFSINIVGEHDQTYLKHFWKGYNPDENPFTEISHQLIDNEYVVLNQAKSSVVCKLSQKYEPGDHTLVVAEVIHSYLSEEKGKPSVHLRKSGLDY